MASVFVYGTLMSPPVVRVLLQREVPMIPAQLEGYIRHPVLNQVYPGMIRSSKMTSFVRGCILPNLSPLEMKLLDYFEGDEYDRATVQVRTAEESVLETTQVYLWKSHLIRSVNQDEEWSYENFCQNHLDWYLKHTVQPCRDEMERLGLTKE